MRPLPALLAAALALAAGSARGDVGSALYERVLMQEAGGRCKLFAPPVQAALTAGALQARGAVLRAGGDPRPAEARARGRAATEPCGSPDLRVAAQRVRAAFLGWSRQSVLALPGENGGWTARRRADRPAPFWSLAARASLTGAPGTLGLRRAAARAPDVPTLETRHPEAGLAWLARISARDPRRAAAPYLARDGAPPAAALATVAASEKTALDGGRAWRFAFPPAAADLIAGLDPREHVRVELMLPGDRSVSALVEAGDFATGRAFLAAGG